MEINRLKKLVDDLRLVVTELRAKDKHLQDQISFMSDDLEKVEAVVKP